MATFHAADLWVAVVPDTSKVGPAMEQAGKESKTKFSDGVKGMGKAVTDEMEQVKKQAGPIGKDIGKEMSKGYETEMSSTGDRRRVFSKQVMDDFKRGVQEREDAMKAEALRDKVRFQENIDRVNNYANQAVTAHQKVAAAARTASQVAPVKDLGAAAAGGLGLDTTIIDQLGNVQGKANETKQTIQDVSSLAALIPGKIGGIGAAVGELAGPLAIVIELLQVMPGWTDRFSKTLSGHGSLDDALHVLTPAMGIYDKLLESIGLKKPPDTWTPVLKDIAKQLTDIPSDKPIKITIKAPDQKVQDLLKAQGFDLENLANGTVRISADTKEAKDTVEHFRYEQASGKPITFKTEADTAKATQQLNALKSYWDNQLISPKIQPQVSLDRYLQSLGGAQAPGVIGPGRAWGPAGAASPSQIAALAARGVSPELLAAVGNIPWSSVPPAPQAPAEPAPREPRGGGGGGGGGGGSGRGGGGGGGSRNIGPVSDVRSLRSAASRIAYLYEVANALAGTPYSQDLRNDCSGMVAQLAAAALGLPPPSAAERFSTPTEGAWLFSHGFKPGLGPPGSLQIGWNPEPGDLGHTAATLPGGEHAESGGSVGPFTIGGAVGGESSQFRMHAYLPMGGRGGAAGGGGPDGSDSDPIYTAQSSKDPSGSADEQMGSSLGKGLVTGVLEALGLDGSVFKSFTGKGPLDWGATKLGMGALNWALGGFGTGKGIGGMGGAGGGAGGAGGIPGLGFIPGVGVSAAASPFNALSAPGGDTHNYWGNVDNSFNVSGVGTPQDQKEIMNGMNAATNNYPAMTANMPAS